MPDFGILAVATKQTAVRVATGGTVSEVALPITQYTYTYNIYIYACISHISHVNNIAEKIQPSTCPCQRCRIPGAHAGPRTQQSHSLPVTINGVSMGDPLQLWPFISEITGYFSGIIHVINGVTC